MPIYFNRIYIFFAFQFTLFLGTKVPGKNEHMSNNLLQVKKNERDEKLLIKSVSKDSINRIKELIAFDPYFAKTVGITICETSDKKGNWHD